MTYRMWRIKNWSSHSAASLSSAKNTNSGIWHAHSKIIRSTLVFIAALYLACLAQGQTQGNAISLIDSYPSNGGGNNPALDCSTTSSCMKYPEALNTGETLVIAATQENSSCNAGVTDPPWGFADTLGNVFTSQTQVSTGANGHLQMACMQVTNPGTDQITVTGLSNAGGCAGGFAVARFKNASCSLDGSLQNASTSAGSGVQTASTSNTTTVNGAVLVSAASPVFGPQGYVRPNGSTAQYAVFNGQGNAGFGDPLLSYAVAGNAGTYSMGSAICCSGSASQQGFMQTIALKPAASIAIADTLLPDAAVAVAYSAQLHCIGGSGAPTTYTLSSGSLPTGLTLHGATGVIDGTPSGSPGTSSLQFTCTATSTSSPQALTLKVGAGFNPIVVKSTATFSANLQPGTATVSASCSDLLIVAPNGADTHGGGGWIPATAGLNSSWSDSFGSPVQRLSVGGGILQAPMVYYIFGPLPASGTDVISYQNNGGGSSGLPAVLLQDISGAQAVIDVGTANNLNTNPVASIAQSLTTVVPNEYVLASTASDNPAATFSFAAPFSLAASGNDAAFTAKAFASATVAAPSTVTATTTVTGSPVAATTVLMALRPALPGACSFAGAGEKKRRSMN